ncbi:MAG: hypothetical protein ACJAST_002834 [Halopseudomonas sp.]
MGGLLFMNRISFDVAQKAAMYRRYKSKIYVKIN